MPAFAPLLASAAEAPPVWSVFPFVLTLLGIAVLPLVAGHWWERNRSKAIFAWVIAVPAAIWWFSRYGGHALEHAAKEYASFITLLGALYIASGGIYLKGTLGGSARRNVSICGAGAVVANLIGTTGASMLLIRPFLRANAHRSMGARVLGVIFFIFSVSNVGGCLTPLGDPPLFLGFLHGVKFQWTLALVKEWAVALAILLTVYYLLDRRIRDEAPPPPATDGFGMEGARNILLLAGVVGVVLGQGIFRWPFGIQEGGMIALAAASMFITPVETRRKNRFTFGPILEVAILFSGIFLTMIPALKILEFRGSELGLSTSWHYFWATGLLSSFLDNAPTYLTFGTAAVAQSGGSAAGLNDIGDLMKHAPDLLAAVSIGSVFMGANTYIGNGPNFMVKAIAEENGVKMPSFFGYMRWSGAILIPIFVLITFLFFV